MRLLALVLAGSLAGCSFFLTNGPGEPQPRVYPDCSSSMGWPIVDGIIGGLMIAAALSTALDDNSSSDGVMATRASGGAIAATAVIGAAFGVGAYVGYSRVSRCRRARTQFTASFPGVQPYQPSYGGYPQPQSYPPPQPQTRPPPPPPQPQPQPQPEPQPQPQPAPPPVGSALGTEGDVCMRNDECSAGLTCQGNVCVRPARRK